jgi:hypothetical protein
VGGGAILQERLPYVVYPQAVRDASLAEIGLPPLRPDGVDINEDIDERRE